jgi:hypothetical protein
VAYIYAPYYDYEVGGINVRGGVTGRDHNMDYDYTNIGTVIVRDCKIVESAYPGLPSGIKSTDPRIVGKPTWWGPGEVPIVW